MTTNPVRVRFAPSPTGTLHIGGARTALYNFLFARANKGALVLRIEDTDRARSTPEALQTIYDGLHWLGLTWDEGPFFQTQRLDKYTAAAETLLASGRAYKREDPGKGTAVVFRIDREYIEWDDCIHGKIGRDITKDPDVVIVKSDGIPTYNFACVIDDADMKITHVIRGDDHVSNTPKQISLFRALQLEPPLFAHIPLILNPDGSKMSKDYKKKGGGGAEQLISTSVLYYRDAGFLPEAVVNFLSLLGWAPGEDREVIPFDELQRIFALDHVNNKSAQFNIEKLLWMNGSYIRSLALDKVVELALPYLHKEFAMERFSGEQVREAVRQQHERLKTLADIARTTEFFFKEEVVYDEKAVAKVLKKEGVKDVLTDASALLGATSFSPHEVETVLKTLAEKRGAKFQEIAQPLRVALTGTMVSPPIHDTICLLGKDRCLARIARALELI